MKKLIDLPVGILIELQEERPFYMNWMSLNEISGGILWKGKK